MKPFHPKTILGDSYRAIGGPITRVSGYHMVNEKRDEQGKKEYIRLDQTRDDPIIGATPQIPLN